MLSSDSGLLGRAQGGDRRAFSALVDRYRPLARAIAYRESGDPELAEDAAQEALAIAWERLGELRDVARFRAWLCGIVRNVLRYRRRHGRRHAPDAGRPAELVEIAAAAPSPLERLIERQRRGAVESELAGLSERYRVPLLLFYGEQLSVREVAAVLGLREETVRQRLARGRRKLRDRVPREQLAAAPWLAGSTEGLGASGAGVGGGQGAAALALGAGGGKGAAIAVGLAVAALVALGAGAPGAQREGSRPQPARVTSWAPPAGAGAAPAAAAPGRQDAPVEPPGAASQPLPAAVDRAPVAIEPAGGPADPVAIAGEPVITAAPARRGTARDGARRRAGPRRARVELGEPEVSRSAGPAAARPRLARPTLLRPQAEPARPALGPLVLEPPGARARVVLK